MSAVAAPAPPARLDLGTRLHLALTQEAPDVRLARRLTQGVFAAATLMPVLGLFASLYALGCLYSLASPGGADVMEALVRGAITGDYQLAFVLAVVGMGMELTAGGLIAFAWVVLAVHLLPLLLLATDRPFAEVPTAIVLVFGAALGQPGPILTLTLAAPAACVWLTMLAIDVERRTR